MTGPDRKIIVDSFRWTVNNERIAERTMIDSMTGYGAGERPLGDASLSVEARSVNHRYLEVSFRGPRWSLPLEGEVREAVKKRFSRGRFDIYVRQGDGAKDVSPIDADAAKSLLVNLKSLKDELGITGEVDLSILTSFRDLLKSADPEPDKDDVRAVLMESLGDALAALGSMREKEGSALANDLGDHLGAVQRQCGEIRERLPEARKMLTARMRERILEIADGIDIDEGRLEQEMIHAAERGDISEELSRLDSHIVQFQEMLENKGPIGRKLDFLTQEMNREANTISSKSIDLTLTQSAVDMKSAIEKIREQVQNVE